MNIRAFSTYLISIITILNLTQAARILGVFPSPSKSHLIIHSAIAETLAAAGHNVTVFGAFPNLLPRAKYNYIQVDALQTGNALANELVNKPEPFYKKFTSLISVILTSANNTMQDQKMQEFLATHKPGDFDAIILGYFMNDFMLGLGAHFQCPVIISFMVRPIFAVNSIVANPELPAYVPTLFGNFKSPMTFMERVKNYLAAFMENNIMATYLQWKTKEMYR